ncbi:MAG TPA: HAD-IC family P-type ATPase [Candidatus Limnocylindria bacterium]|jgi:Ca2+-transporting ATPase|nr:HAD-IC family P-type ATPase [Candidatus Limnocylindria bacterium]
MGPFHAKSSAEAAAELGVDPSIGLTDAAARERLAQTGPNELEKRQSPTLPHLIWEAATEPFILLLLAAGVLAVALGETRDGLLMLAGLVPIVGADVVTEYRAERALHALRMATAPHARVRRAGRVIDGPVAELVPGDVVLLHTGDVVPADLRLTWTDGLQLDRSALTGESLPEAARTDPDPLDAPIAEQSSMAFAGMAVVSGTAIGLVVATGAATELGRIAASLSKAERRRSPVQRELDRLVRMLLIAAAALILITVGLGFARGQTAGASLLAGISAAIAAIPEEPPILLAVVLGIGAHRLLRKKVLVHRLNAQETLGAVDLILTDKTGTLTQNRLAVAAVVGPDGPMEGPSLVALLTQALRAEDDAWHASEGGAVGSFTRAISQRLADLGAEAALDPRELLDCRGPTDDRPYSWTRTADGELALGAPEAVLGLCPPMFGTDARRWQAAVTLETERGGRTLLLASHAAGGDWQPQALVVFADPLRPEARAAMQVAREAGIQAVMVTGDHPVTAAAIARDAGLDASHVVTGPDLAVLDDDQLVTLLPQLRVVARAVPQQKLRLVDAARRSGRTVAVTGDGVNDAPALHRADVAVAMGSGTQVAREAADLVLGDDSFATLMDGLREGRRMVENIRKGLVFLVSTHVALLGFILIATLAGFGQPLLPLQILWLELFIDLSASVAFEREPEEPGEMRRPPRPRGLALLPAGLLARIAAAGAFTAVAALAVMQLRGGDFEHARWLAFTVLAIGQSVRAYANRSLGMPVLRLPRNTFLLIACLVVVAVQVVIPYVPQLALAFHASPLSAGEWAVVALLALLPAALAEVIRAARRGDWVA